MNWTAQRFATLMGSVSLLTLTAALNANAQQTAQATPGEVPEQVLVTGSLIHGAAAVGVRVTNLGVQDFIETGKVTIGELFRTIPDANVPAGPILPSTPAVISSMRPGSISAVSMGTVHARC